MATAWARAAAESEVVEGRGVDSSPAEAPTSRNMVVRMADVEAAMKRVKARQGKELGTPQVRSPCLRLACLLPLSGYLGALCLVIRGAVVAGERLPFDAMSSATIIMAPFYAFGAGAYCPMG